MNITKKKNIADNDAKNLKEKSWIEGRKPNYFVGVDVAKIVNKKAEYSKNKAECSKNKAFDKQYCLDLVLKPIGEHKSLNRHDIDELLWKKLPDWMNDNQRKNRISNLISLIYVNSHEVNDNLLMRV